MSLHQRINRLLSVIWGLILSNYKNSRFLVIFIVPAAWSLFREFKVIKPRKLEFQAIAQRGLLVSKLVLMFNKYFVQTLPKRFISLTLYDVCWGSLPSAFVQAEQHCSLCRPADLNGVGDWGTREGRRGRFQATRRHQAWRRMPRISGRPLARRLSPGSVVPVASRESLYALS